MDAEQRRAAAQQEGGGWGLGLTLLVALLVAFFSLVLIPSLPAAKNSISILHQVPEGHVGVYWIGGALLKTITPPGFHVKMPLITHFEPIQVTLQTDLVRDIPCGTKGGVLINFEKIEVVNRLHKDFVYDTLRDYGVQYDNTWIYDKIHHEINQFCSAHSLQQVYIDMFDQIDEKMKDALQADCTRYAPGIEIISVRVTKPSIPESIRRNFEQMEGERTKVLIAVERQRVVEKEAETQKKVAISEAEKNAQVSMIQMEQKLMEKDSARRQEEIANEMYKAREKSLADADFYRAMKEAEANKLRLTPQYLELKFIEAITNNSKIFFGNKVMQKVVAMVQKLGQAEPQRAKLVSENTKLQHSITRLERERNQTRADAEVMKTKLDSTKDGLKQALIELEVSKTECKTAYQQGYNEGINTATKSYKVQMLGIQDEIWAAALVASLTKAQVVETSPLWIENDLRSSQVVPEEDFVEEEDSLDRELNADVSEQLAADADQEPREVTNPGQKEASGGINVESSVRKTIQSKLPHPLFRSCPWKSKCIFLTIKHLSYQFVSPA